MTVQPPKPRRRWFQFSLRSLLIAVTLVAGLLAAWRVYVEPYRRQRLTMKDAAVIEAADDRHLGRRRLPANEGLPAYSSLQ